jgi:hypothetical protein
MLRDESLGARSNEFAQFDVDHVTPISAAAEA